MLATGSRPRSLPGITPDGKAIITSDEILELKEIPKSLIVIGAGAVGIEFASIFARFGSTVTVIEMLPRVLPLEDEEISAEAAKLLAKHMTIHTGARTEAALKTASGVEVGLPHRDRASRRRSPPTLLLVAVGRGPVTDGLGLESTKVAAREGATSDVNDRMETDEPGVYAIGDVVTRRRQAAPAARPRGLRRGHRRGRAAGRQARRARQLRPRPLGHLLPARDGGRGPHRGRGEEARLRRARSAASPSATWPSRASSATTAGFVKVVSEAKYDEVLGVHIVGPHATDLISEACVALRLEATTEEIARTIHPHPTLPEALMQAAEAVVRPRHRRLVPASERGEP